MNEDRKGILEAILRELLTPMEQRLEMITQENLEIKQLLKRIEQQQENILSELK